MDISMWDIALGMLRFILMATLVGVTCGILSFMGWYMDKKSKKNGDK